MSDTYHNPPRFRPPVDLLRPITYPWPWSYQLTGYGRDTDVVTDADGRQLATGVRRDCGPLLAAGPELLVALWRVAHLTRPESPAHQVAVRAIEAHLEREGMQLDRPPPWDLPRWGKLRVVGVAT